VVKKVWDYIKQHKLQNPDNGREQQHRDDEASEIDLAAVAERMVRIGGLFRPLHAQEEQRLVPGIDHAASA
jgi:hypothetical protein